MEQRTAVGIEVDEGVVQAVELTAEGERLVIRRAVCEPLRPGTFAEGELTDPAELAETIRRILRRHGLSRRNLCLALGGRRTIARIIDIPNSGEGEVDQLLQERISRYAFYEDRQITWRGSLLETDAIGMRSCLTASAVSDEVGALLPALRKLGIFLTRVEPYALSTIRALATCASGDERPTILVSLRNETTDFLLVKGPHPLLIRSVEQGARELGMRPDAVDGLLLEAKRAIGYCRHRFPEAAPRLWFCVQATEGLEGAAVLGAQLKEVLTDIEVGSAPPWPDLAAGAEVAEGAEQAWAAVGAAMVGLARYEAVDHLNLVPPEWAEIQRVQKHLIGVAGSIASAILLTAAITTVVRVTIGDTAAGAQAASIQMQANTNDVKVTAKLRHRAAAAVTRVELWKEVRAQTKTCDWVTGLQGLMAAVPEGVRVREVQQRRGALRILGEAASIDLVHAYVQKLSAVPQIEDASIERLVAGDNGQPLPSYTIKCRFRLTAPPEPEDERGRKP